MPAILAKKLGMTQLFMEDGRVERVTVLEAGPCPVTGIRTFDRDGYEAVQLAFGVVKEMHLSKPELGHLKKADALPMKHVVEFRNDDPIFHDWEVEGLANVDAGARPGQTTRLRFVIDEPGTYAFLCTVPGHAEAGMRGTLVVE